MKKTLVALAVLAATGTSFAQVNLTGEFTWGYKADKNSAGDTTSGFGVDYSNMNLSVTEDIGSTKLSLFMSLDGMDRGNDGYDAVSGNDAYLQLDGTFGRIKVGTVRNKDYLSEGVAAAGDPAWLSMDSPNGVFSAHTNADRIEYSFPITKELKVGYQFLESDKGLTEGVGISGSASTTGQARNLVQIDYKGGAWIANAGYGKYSSKDGFANGTDDLIRASASYDFGMGSVGLGASKKKYTTGSQQDVFVAGNIGFGNVTLAANWGQRKETDTGMKGTVSGFGLGAAYALSKRTSLITNYRSWEAAVNPANKSSQYRFYIDHTF